MTVRTLVGASVCAVACAVLLCTQSFAQDCFFSDLDSNGEPDYAYVADCDSDGILEMEDDIQAAINALTDNGSKLVEIAPGSFLPPLTAAGKNGIVELPSNITVGGAGPEATILNGFAATDLTSLQAVVSNDSHGLGNENITLRDLEIDGGWLDGDPNAMPPGQHRMGVFWNHCRNCLVEGVAIHDTLHACLYSKNGYNVTFRDNSLSLCGNYYGDGPAYSCVYVYAGEREVQERVYITGNTCSGSGSAGISLRRADLAATLKDIYITGNTVSATRDYGSWIAPCMMLRGAEHVEVTGNNVCDGTGGVQTMDVDDYYENDAGAIKNLLIADLEVRNGGPSEAGLTLMDYIDGVDIRRVLVDGTAAGEPCVKITNPLRNAVFDQVTLRACGANGIRETDTHGSGHQADEALTLRNITVESNGAEEAILFQGPAHGLLLDGVFVTDAPGNGIRFLDRLFDARLLSTTVDGSVGDGIKIDAGASNVTIDRASISNTGGDGVHLHRGGGPDPAIVRIANSTFSAIGGRGIRIFADSYVLADVAVQRCSFAGIGYQAIMMEGGTSGSDRVTVEANQISDFGGTFPGSVDSRGVEVTGPMTQVEVANNIIDDVNQQAQCGIYIDTTFSPAGSSLCTNLCSGTLTELECILVAGEPDYQLDGDSDGAVEPCDCAPTDNMVYPRAPEVNDARDNQCPGYPGYGIIDETSGDSGFHDEDKARYSWTPQAGATSYQVKRAVDRAFQYSGACEIFSSTEPYVIDVDEPLQSGDCFYYLNHPTRLNIGSWGVDSARVERTLVCP